MFQSTPLREGRPIPRQAFQGVAHVSIHAPARGATWAEEWERFVKAVSIHAPARGATSFQPPIHHCHQFQSTPLREGRRWHMLVEGKSGGFNPRPCARGDLDFVELDRIGGVSIHAPARGATSRNCATLTGRKSFNPRPCARGDLEKLRDAHGPQKFQSTPLREGRHGLLTGIENYARFQSTPLREGRQTDAEAKTIADKFQSTPLREGRLNLRVGESAPNKFQSTPLREGRPYTLNVPVFPLFVSIHAPARGATLHGRCAG